MSAKIHAEITAAIVAELEQGVAPWVKPWKSGKGGQCMPFNAATKRPYRGVNVLTLWASAIRGGYPLPRWLTFRQAAEIGGHVRKGEKGTPIVLVKQMTVGDEGEDGTDDTGQGAAHRVTFLRYFWVFNVAQVEGLPPHLYAVPEPEPEGERHARTEAFLAALGADIRHGGDRACYVPGLDCIMLPPFGAFDGPEHYYATRLHETAHGRRIRAGSTVISPAVSAARLMRPRSWSPSSPRRSCAPSSGSRGGSGMPNISAAGSSCCARTPKRSSPPPAGRARRRTFCDRSPKSWAPPADYNRPRAIAGGICSRNHEVTDPSENPLYDKTGGDTADWPSPTASVQRPSKTSSIFRWNPYEPLAFPARGVSHPGRRRNPVGSRRDAGGHLL